MSVKLSAYVWDGCSAAGLKGNKLLIMLRLADYASDEGIAFPGIDTISRQLGAGRSTVIALLSELARGGWLEKQERRLGQRNMSNLYILNVAKLRKAAEKGCQSLHNHQGPESGLSKVQGLKTGLSENQGPKSGPSEPQGLKIGPSEYQGPESGLSDSQGPKSERSENPKKRHSHRPKTGPDPSVNSKHDPSDLKPLCPVSPKPDPEIEITDHAIRVLNHLNRVAASRFQKSRSSLEYIRARLREGYSVGDLELVVDYKHEHWRGTRLYDYMQPRTLFRAGKFEGYFSSAIRWNARGRLPRDKWDDPSAPSASEPFRASYQDVDYSSPGGFR